MFEACISNRSHLLFYLQSIPFVEIALPIGISFFTFQILSYAFDVYYKKAQVQNNILDLSLYIVLFPQLIAGPIVRYETIADQIENRQETFEDFSLGLRRFVVGLAKKCLLADSIVLVADYIYGLPQVEQCGVILWLGAIAYTFQIYFDFSGYSDMAIGLGRMFGFKFEENFNYPYIASSITDFWSFAKRRLAKFNGCNSATFVLHLKECALATEFQAVAVQ